jgi:histidinol phosphatase-like enzyme (inositol monophosphatase family)
MGPGRRLRAIIAKLLAAGKRSSRASLGREKVVVMLRYSESVPVAPAKREEYLRFGLEVAAAAGSATLPFFRAEFAVENKRDDGRFDPVTEADRAAEQVFRKALRERYPEHGVFGEEYGFEAGNGLTWVIDPIDGTRAFMTGMLHWGLLLALFDGRQPILGIMHQPFTGEFFYGDNQTAFYRNGAVERRMHARRCASLTDAVLTTTSPGLFRGAGEREAFDRLEKRVKLSKYGGDCYIYAMVAMGYVDLATDAGLQPYDIQALVPIIRGAGGIISTKDGGDPSMGGFIVAAGCEEVHRAALDCLAGR